MGYPSDLTDEQWAVIEPIVTFKIEEELYKGGRKRTVSLRAVVNALLYMDRTGIQWRYFPSDFPPSGTIRYYFDKWTWDGTWEAVNTAVRELLREQDGRNLQPTAGIVDSQTVKTTEAGGKRGYDGGKKIKGRKRHILVDTMGNLLRVVVHSARLQDRDGADYVFEDIKDEYSTLSKVWADQGYTGDLGADLLERYSINLEIAEKPSVQKGFVLLPRRWVVERILAWLNRYRRLSKDYECRYEYSESWIYIASISRMLRKLHPNKGDEPAYKRKSQPVKRNGILGVCS